MQKLKIKLFKINIFKYTIISFFFNALFKSLYFLTILFSLMRLCVYPKSSFFSSIWRTPFAQYFSIYAVLCLGNAFRLCCNVSCTFFSISRVTLVGTSNKNRLRIFVEEQNFARFYVVTFCLALLLVNTLFQDYNGKRWVQFEYKYWVRCEVLRKL